MQTAVINNIHKYERHFKYLQDALIPLPPPNIQQKIVSEIEAIESAEAIDLQVIEATQQKISDFVRGFENSVATETVCKIRSEKVEPSKIGDKLIYIGLEHIESNTGKLTEKQNAVEANLQSTKNAFYKGDVLFGKLRPYLNKVYVAEFDGVCSTDILVLQTDHAGVLQRALLHEDFVAQTSSMMKGINLPRLQVKDFAHLTIHFPDDPQQKSSELEIEEQKITAAQARLDSIASQKAAVLQKYL